MINGLRFLRQYGVGPYILDFYCPKYRSAYLETEDIKIIRFWNSEVLKDIEKVIVKIPLLR